MWEQISSNKIKSGLLVAFWFLFRTAGDWVSVAFYLMGLILDRGWDASVEVHYTNHSNMPHEGPDFYDLGYIVHGD